MTKREIARPIGAIDEVVARGSGGVGAGGGDLSPVARTTGHRRRQRRALQFGGFPQWWPPSQALQRQVQDPLVAMRIVVQLLTVRVPPEGRQQTPEYGWTSTYNDLTIVRPTVKIKDSGNGARFCHATCFGAAFSDEHCVKLFGCSRLRGSGRGVARAESEVLDVVDGFVEQLRHMAVV